MDREFPLQLWCYLLFQEELTLNLLRTARFDPSKSKYEALEGKFNYNATPLAPREQNPLYMKHQTGEPHGHHMQWMHGTSAQQ